MVRSVPVDRLGWRVEVNLCMAGVVVREHNGKVVVMPFLGLLMFSVCRVSQKRSLAMS